MACTGGIAESTDRVVVGTKERPTIACGRETKNARPQTLLPPPLPCRHVCPPPPRPRWFLTQDVELEDLVALSTDASNCYDLGGHVVHVRRSFEWRPVSCCDSKRRRAPSSLVLLNGSFCMCGASSRLRVCDFTEVEICDVRFFTDTGALPPSGLALCEMSRDKSGATEDALVEIKSCGRVRFVRVEVTAAGGGAESSVTALLACRSGQSPSDTRSGGISLFDCLLHSFRAKDREIAGIVLLRLRCVRICGMEICDLVGRRIDGVRVEMCGNCVVDRLRVQRLDATVERTACRFAECVTNSVVFDAERIDASSKCDSVSSTPRSQVTLCSTCNE